MTGSYCLLSLKKSHVSHHIIFRPLLQHVLKMSASSTNESVQTLMALDNSTFNNCAIQSGPLAVNASFQFVDLRDLDRLSPD